MYRLAKKHWRVESELWVNDEDYRGLENFVRGESIGFESRDEAFKHAVRELEVGRWVKVQQYGFDFDDKKED